MFRRITQRVRPLARCFGGGGFDNHNGLYPNRLGIYAGATYPDDMVPGSDQGFGDTMPAFARTGGFEEHLPAVGDKSYETQLRNMSEYLSNISLSPALQKAEFYRSEPAVEPIRNLGSLRLRPPGSSAREKHDPQAR